MKKIFSLLVFALVAVLPARASDLNPLETFRAGLQAFQANGPAALLNAWYPGDTDTKRPELRSRLLAISDKLGAVVETETFDPKPLGKRVTRLYGVIYFKKRPLWLRVDYYIADGAGGIISLDFSTRPEEILPLEVGIR